MELNDEQKAIKKELAKHKRKISEIAGQIHDIVEDTLWSDYDVLPELSHNIQDSMKEMLDFKLKHDCIQLTINRIQTLCNRKNLLKKLKGDTIYIKLRITF